MPTATEKHKIINKRNSQGDTRQALPNDRTPRIKWTPELQEPFLEAVNQLGGARKATPNKILKLMGIQGVTLSHVKSHLQKYRMSKNFSGQVNIRNIRNGEWMFEAKEENMNNMILGSFTNEPESLQMSKTLNMQIEVQKRIHTQLELLKDKHVLSELDIGLKMNEVQPQLQVQVAQGEYPHSVLERAKKRQGSQDPGSSGAEATKEQLSKAVSKTPLNLSSSFQACYGQVQQYQPPTCSMNSCLTSCNGAPKYHKTYYSGVDLRANHINQRMAPIDTGNKQTDPAWLGTPKENNESLYSAEIIPALKTSDDFTTSIEFQGKKGSSASSFSEIKTKEREEDKNLHGLASCSTKPEKEKISISPMLPCFRQKLDLNL